MDLPFSQNVRDDEYYMRIALEEAKHAYDNGEVPIGAVVVCDGEIIGRGYNQTESLQDVTAHAEMIAITSAQNYLGAKSLPQCTLYVTVEPCAMCAGASMWSRLQRVVWGVSEPKVGFSTLNPRILHPKTTITSGILEDECRKLMQSFFKSKR